MFCVPFKFVAGPQSLQNGTIQSGPEDNFPDHSVQYGEIFL